MIEAERAAKAVEYLINSAAEYGAARADQARTEHMLKVTKALAMKSSGESSAAAQEREALASDAYLKAVDEVFEATKDAETLRALREAAIQTIEAWRSMEATSRAAERGFHSAR
jgi:ribonuclease D